MYLCINMFVCLFVADKQRLAHRSKQRTHTSLRLPAAYHRHKLWRFVFVVLPVFALSLNN